MIEQDLVGPRAQYSLDATIFASAISGLSRSPGNNQLASMARELWSRYSSLVPITTEPASKMLSALGRLGLFDEAYQLYRRILTSLPIPIPSQEVSESISFFDAWARLPLDGQSLLERANLLDEMQRRELPIPHSVWLALLAHAEINALPGPALAIMQRLVRTYREVPLLRAVCLLFFRTLARYDGGRLRREARAWLDRLLPPARAQSPWLRSIRPLGTPAETVGEGLLSVVQSLEVARYIESIDASTMVPPPTPTVASLQDDWSSVEDELLRRGFAKEDVAALIDDMDEPSRALDQKLRSRALPTS